MTTNATMIMSAPNTIPAMILPAAVVISVLRSVMAVAAVVPVLMVTVVAVVVTSAGTEAKYSVTGQCSIMCNSMYVICNGSEKYTYIVLKARYLGESAMVSD